MRRGMRGTVAAGVGASVVVGAVLLTGCGAGTRGGSSVTPSATTTPTAAPVASPTPTPSAVAPETVKPERPAAMGTPDVDGAVAAATYFLQLYPYVYATGDLEEWTALSHPECIFCASAADGVREQEAVGGRSEGGLVEIESTFSATVTADHYSITVVASQGPSTDYDAAGGVVARTDMSRSLLTVLVWREGDHWLIRGVEVQEAPAS